MGKEHNPVVTNPVMESNTTVRGFSFEVGGGVTKQQAHLTSPCQLA
jgi:hypothetical protein